MYLRKEFYEKVRGCLIKKFCYWTACSVSIFFSTLVPDFDTVTIREVDLEYVEFNMEFNGKGGGMGGGGG